MKTASLHDIRNEMVRKRANKVLRQLPAKTGNLTNYGMFLKEALRISFERGVPLSTAKHPDQYVTDLRSWAEGKNNIALHRLDSIELTCMFFEEKAKAAQTVEREIAEVQARTTQPTLPLFESGRPELASEAAQMFGEGQTLSEPKQALTEAPTPANGDPELDAMQAIVHALEPLDKESRKRVIRYAGDRFTFMAEIEESEINV